MAEIDAPDNLKKYSGLTVNTHIKPLRQKPGEERICFLSAGLSALDHLNGFALFHPENIGADAKSSLGWNIF